VPSIAEFEAVPGGFVADRNNFGLGVGRTLGQGLTASFEGLPVTMRAAYLVLSDGTRSLTLAEADPDSLGELDVQEPSVVRFSGAFGELADLEYVVCKGGYHQNVVINRPIALPAGFDVGASQVLVYSQISYDDLLSNRSVKATDVDGEIDLSALNSFSAPSEEEISFQMTSSEGRNLHLFSFGDSEVWDSPADPEDVKRIVGEKQLFRSEDGVTYLVERVSHSFLSDARYPVAMDYEVKTGSMTQDEIWSPPNTYYISGTLVVSGAKLTIRPGTTIKFEDGVNAYLEIKGGACLEAEGQPYDYIVFTSKQDDLSGEDLTEGSTSGTRADYKYAVYLRADASTNSVIKYCKVGYAYYGIRTDKNTSALPPIANNIISQCRYGIWMYRQTDAKNNLITDCNEAGIYAQHGGSPQYESLISNNTFNACFRALSCYWTNVVVTAKYNIFSNCGYGVADLYDYATVSLDYNAYYHNTYYDVYNCAKGSHAVTLPHNNYPSDSPFESSPLGDFYLKQEGFDQLKNKPNSDPELGFSAYVFTTQAPAIAPTSINGDDSWTKVDYETTTSVVDIGYHHNRVDKLLNDANTTVTNGTLTITSGVVVAIKGHYTLRLSTGAKLVCHGDPWEGGYNIVAGAKSLSAKIESPGILIANTGYVWLDSGSSDQTTVEFTRFRWLCYGLYPAKSLLPTAIRNNWFELCHYGCIPTDCNNTFTNNLYYGNEYGLKANLLTTKSYNNTFDSNNVGIWLARVWSLESLEAKDCLFTNNGQAIRRTGYSGGLTTEYNAFYGNGENVWDGETSQSLSIGSNSLALVNSPSDPGSLWWDRYRLNRDGPVIDAGSVLASDANRELATFTTDKDDAADAARPDRNQVDIGCHYPLATSDSKWSSVSVDNPYFAGSVTFDVEYTDPDTEWTLKIYTYSGQTPIFTSEPPDTEPKTWNSSGYSDGTYRYEIIPEDSYTTTITGYVVKDSTAPTDLVITWPQNGQSVIGL
jgi:hypothetical protein